MLGCVEGIGSQGGELMLDGWGWSGRLGGGEVETEPHGGVLMEGGWGDNILGSTVAGERV